MTYFNQAGICFALGALVQAFLMTASAKQYARFFYIAVGSFVLSVFGILGYGQNLGSDGRYVALAFCFQLFLSVFVSFIYKEHIIRPITEQHLLHLNLVFLYVLFVTNAFAHLPWQATLVVGLASGFVLLEAFLVRPLRSPFLRTLAYGWHMIMTLSFIYLHFVPWMREITKSNDALLGTSLLSFFIEGMTFFAILVYTYYVYYLIMPIGKTGFRQERSSLLSLMSKRYSGHQLSHLKSALIIAVQGGFLALNYVYKFAPDRIIIGLCIVVFPLLLNSGIFFPKK